MAIQIHEKKKTRQIEGLKKWTHAADLGLSNRNGWGTFWWETGVGKTYAACMLCCKMLEKNDSQIFIIIVPGPELDKQWKAEINNNVPEEYHDNFRVFTIHKLMEILAQGLLVQTTLLILDELHEYYTEERIKIITESKVVTKYCLGLTADYEDRYNRQRGIESILPVVDRISPEEAEREGFISKFFEYNVGITFNDYEQEKYDILTQTMTKNLSKFGHGGLELAGRILQGDKDRGLSSGQMAFAYATHKGWTKNMDLSVASNAELNSTWNPSTVIGYAKNAMDSIRDRKNLIYCAINKIKVATELAIKFEDLKTIFFSQSTAFADVLARTINNKYSEDYQRQTIPCVVYHSQLQTQITIDPITGKKKKKGKTVLKREAIEAIRSGKARRISTSSSLDKGLDVKDIRMGVTTSGTQNPIQDHQRSGRPKRVENYEEDIYVLIINLYVKDTIDERWLRKRQSKKSNVIYWVDSIDDINYTPKKKESFNLMDI